MKLLIVVLQGQDSGELMQDFSRHGYCATLIDSASGFFSQRNATLLVGVQDVYTADVLRIVREHGRSRALALTGAGPVMEPGEYFVPSPVNVLVGGVSVFIVNVERYERIA